MNTKNLLAWIALFGGEAIIIASYILWGAGLDDNIFVMNITVSSIVYILVFTGIKAPWINLDDKSQKQVGSLGVRWFFTGLYISAAIAVMIVGNVLFEWSFALQIILHGFLVFCLILGFSASLHASDKVQQVYQNETNNRNGIIEMKKAMVNLKDKLTDLSGLPEDFIDRINILEDNLHYITPTKNAEGYRLEQQFIHIINDISFAVTNFSMNEQAIENNLKKVERIYQNRKSIYSN